MCPLDSDHHYLHPVSYMKQNKTIFHVSYILFWSGLICSTLHPSPHTRVHMHSPFNVAKT